MNPDPDTQIVIDNRAFPLDVRATPLDDHWTFTAQKEKSIPIDENREPNNIMQHTLVST